MTDCLDLDYENYFGPVETPQDLVRWMEFQGRRRGKTTKLISVLPNKPCIVHVNREVDGRDIIRRIREIRPDYNIGNIQIVTREHLKPPHIDRIVRGRRGVLPVYVDNGVLDTIACEYVSSVGILLNPHEII